MAGDSAGAGLAVDLDLHGVAPDRPLVLEGFAPSHEIKLGPASARSGYGSPLDVRVIAHETPRVEIAAPGSGHLHVRYVVHPGSNVHGDRTGQVKRCPSAVGRHFVLARGRDVFLLPDPPERVRHITVSFDLPPGWKSFAPWNPAGASTRVELRGRDAAEQLTGTPFALGDLVADAFTVGATRFHLVTERSLPSGRRATARRDLERAARDLFGVFGRSLGSSYTVLAAGLSESGDEVTGDGWGTGQGSTLIPLTTKRLHGFARRLAGAYLEVRPYRSEFRRASDYWVSVAASELFALEATARARGADDRNVAKYLIAAYGGLQEDPAGLETALLERPDDRKAQLLTETAGAATLSALEREVLRPRAASSGAGRPLHDLFRRLVRQRRIDSFWDALPSSGRQTPRAFRDRYVIGRAPLPLKGRDSLNLEPEPVPPRVTASKRVRIAYTSQGLGYLENCGCKVSQEGGLPRRSTVIRELRADRGTPLLVLDAGSSLADPRFRGDDEWSLAEQGLYVATVAGMGYDAMALGTTELSQPASILGSLLAGPLPYVCANVTRNGRPLAPAFRSVGAGGITCRVIGVFEPLNPLATPAQLEEGLDSLVVEDPLRAIARVAEGPPDDELVIVIGELSPGTMKRIARSVPRVDLIVTSQFEARGEPLPFSARGGDDIEFSGYLGATALAVGAAGQYAVDTMSVGVANDGRPSFLTHGSVQLNDYVADDPAVRRQFDVFYARMSHSAAGANVEVPLVDDPTRFLGRFVGAKACATCHAAEHEQWLGTHHADALHTLMSVHRSTQPRCVACHVVAMGAPTGYRMGGKTDHLAGVQCETCHGPGGEHAAAPSRANILRQVPERVCRSCHTPEHSDDFDYATRLPRIVHRPETRTLAAAAAAAVTAGPLATPRVRGTRSRPGTDRP